MAAGVGVAGGFAIAPAAGATVEYRIVVPKAGTYQLTYRAAGAQTRIRSSVNGSVHTTTIPTSGYSQVTGPRLTLPAGTHTLLLSTPDTGSAGWHLDWMSLQRL